MPDIGHRRWENNRMCLHMLVRSYRRYYSRHVIVIMTVVTTVAMDYHTTTHAIFFLTGARCRAPMFLKNRMCFTYRVETCQ